jgi:ATP synthase F1 complex assembly factor 1
MMSYLFKRSQMAKQISDTTVRAVLRHKSVKAAAEAAKVTQATLSDKNVAPEVKIDHVYHDNPYFAKYKDKLKKVYSEDPQEFIDKVKNFKQEKHGDGPPADIIEQAGLAHSMTKKKTLESLMKVEMLNDVEPIDLKDIWINFMEEKNRHANVLSLDDYFKIITRVKKFKMFLMPLPREEGYEFMLCQWSGNECHFTPLINYQAHGENAPSVITAVYFDDLMKTKQMILETAEVDFQVLKMEEAKFLMHQLHKYYLYSEDDDEKFLLMSKFTSKPDEFKHMDLIDQIKKDNLTVDQFIKS